MKPTIVIEVSGGVVNEVTSDTDVDLIILDYDNIKGGDAVDISPGKATFMPTDALRQYLEEVKREHSA